MGNLKIAGVLFIGAGLLGATSAVQAQRVVVPSTPPRQITIVEFTAKFKRHLESVGYTDVTLTPTDKGIHGFATKNGRRVGIIVDGDGRIRTQDPA